MSENMSGNPVSCVWREGDFIYKRQPKYLCDNAEHSFDLLRDTPYVPPDFERLDLDLIRMRFLVGEPVTVPGLFLANCQAFLNRMRKAGLRHGDLTRPHVFVVGECPCVIDWAESRVGCDPRPDKRPEGDEFWMWRTVWEILRESGQ